MDYTITSTVHLRLHRPNGEIKNYLVPWFGDADSRSAVEIYTWYRKLYRAKVQYNGWLEVVSVQYVIPYELNMLVFWRLLDMRDKARQLAALLKGLKN